MGAQSSADSIPKCDFIAFLMMGLTPALDTRCYRLPSDRYSMCYGIAVKHNAKSILLQRLIVYIDFEHGLYGAMVK